MSSSSGFFSRKAQFSDTSSVNGYAVSISQTSIAASSILNFDALTLPVQEVEQSEKHQWREGHCLRWKETAENCECEVCFDVNEKGMFICDGTLSSSSANQIVNYQSIIVVWMLSLYHVNPTPISQLIVSAPHFYDVGHHYCLIIANISSRCPWHRERTQMGNYTILKWRDFFVLQAKIQVCIWRC
jgi:hypothetical protein